MKAIHVNSTAPFFTRNKDKPYSIESFSLYCTVISALQWRKMNGEIYMITDSIAADYYKRLGIEGVWNGVLPLLPADLEGIDADTFWAAGKLLALRDFEDTAALVDEDFIVWEKLELPENAVTVAHREYLAPDVYPDPKVFGAKEYPVLEQLDMEAQACNTAFLYIPDKSFRQFYVNHAIAFMKSMGSSADRLCPMVFAEQRLLGMLCAYTGINVNTLMDQDRLFIAQEKYTHLWGAKQAMRDNEEYREKFIVRCRKRIESDFPDFSYVIEAIERKC